MFKFCKINDNKKVDNQLNDNKMNDNKMNEITDNTTDDTTLLKYTSKKIIFTSPLVQQIMEDKLQTWSTDASILQAMLIKSIKNAENKSQKQNDRGAKVI